MTIRDEQYLVRLGDDPLLVGYDDDRRTRFLVQLTEGRGQTMEAPEVDPGFRFIEDHDRRVFRENGRDLDPLDLAAGQGSVRLAVQVIAGTQSHL